MKLPNETSKGIYKKQLKTALFSWFCEVPNLIFSIILAFESKTILCWIDSAISLSVVIHFTIVVLITLKMIKETGDKYNYGMERLETLTSFICDMIIMLAMIGLLASSIYGFFVPQFPTVDLYKFFLLKCFNVAFDVYFFINGYLIKKKRPSRLTETEFLTYLSSLIHDSLILVTSLLCAIFRESLFAAYLSPAVGIISILYFGWEYVKHLKGSIEELADISIPIRLQDSIFDVVLENNEHISFITAVNCHRLNGKNFVDLSLKFKENTSYDEEMQFLENVKKQINEILPECSVRLVLENN